MDEQQLHTIALTDGYSVVLDPSTLFWVLLDPDHASQTKTLTWVREIYTADVQKQLEADRDVMSSAQLVDMVELHPTTACNMRCSYCYIPTSYRQKPLTMNRQEIEQTMSKLFDWIDQEGGMKRIIFHGAEPLLAKDAFFPVIDNHWRNVEFGITTNGTLLTAEDARFIRERNVHISISLDGHTKRINDRFRQYLDGSGTFDDIVRAIELFKDHKWTGVILTITKHNVEHLGSIAQTLFDWGVPSALFNPVSPSNPEVVDIMPSTESLLKGYRGLIDTLLALNSGEGNHRLVVDNIESLVVALLTSNMKVLFCHMTPCGAGRFIYVIASDGDVYPCDEFVGREEFRCGNIFRDSVRDILNSSVCTSLRARSVEVIDECRHCTYRQICGANCPAAVYSMNGHLYARSPYCGFMKGSINLIFETFARHGIESAYKLVSPRFEEILRESEILIDINQWRKP